MSWHCGICGDSEEVTGLMYIVDIRGGIPIRGCIHIKCLAKQFKEWGCDDVGIELNDLDNENKTSFNKQ